MKRTFIDRAVGYISPEALVRRDAARKTLEGASTDKPKVHRRGYDSVGARPAMVGGNMFALGGSYANTNLSADTENYGSLRILRDQSRELTRNSPLAASALNSHVTAIVGAGIMPRPMSDDPAENAKVKAAFDSWCEQCDFSGRSDFVGMQVRAVRQMIEAGEVLVRRRIDADTSRTTAPLELQILEADFLDAFRNGVSEDGGMIKQGVEIAQTGARVGKVAQYWLFPGPNHPGDLFFNSQSKTSSEPVDSRDVIHMFEQKREQSRGEPWITPSIETIQNLNEYEFNEQTRKKFEACAVAVVNTDDDFQVGLNQVRDEFGENIKLAGACDAMGNPVERLEPGMILYTSGGKTVQFTSPASVGGYGEYKYSILCNIASGMRLTYEDLSSDTSRSNYTSIRAGQINYRRFVRQVQQHIIIPQMLNPVWKWFCESAFLKGLIPNPTVKVEWSVPPMEWINPSEDVEAAILSIQSGIRSYDDVVSELGRDPNVVRAEISEYQRGNRDEYKIVTTTDPSAVTGKGVLQKADSGGSPAKPDHGEKTHDGTRALNIDPDTILILERMLERALKKHDRKHDK